jgi:two-component system chemotaxis sensor kinase CheA
MDDLLGDFVAETREMLDALGGEIVAWEAQPGDKARLDAIFRFFHTVKGNCGFFDFPRLEAVSHAAEDLLADIRAGRRHADTAAVSAVLAVLDRIGAMIEAIAAGEPMPAGDDSALIEALQTVGENYDVQAPVAAGSGAGRGAARSVRVSVELLDQVMSGVSDIVLARNELARRLRGLPDETVAQGAFERLSAMIAQVRDAMTRTRMQPIDGLFATLPRMVRDLSAQLGKQVMIDVDPGDVELDREMIELIRDPLLHLVRNAVDHGIETPAERLKSGKREIGLLVVSARQSGNQILIECVDDGRGLDLTRLKDKAIAAGVIDAAAAAALSPADAAMLVCEPGLSTAAAVTEISGRGVGMDVVRANVEKIGGAVAIDTTANAGTRFTLRVPLTLAITPALVVGAGTQSFAIPRSYIEEIVDPRSSAMAVEELGGRLVAGLRGGRLPVVSLAEVLGIEREAPLRQTLVVIRLTGGNRYVLAVDRLLDHEELVVKPVAPAVMATGIYAGCTLSEDGLPLLLLDVTGIARLGGVKLEMHDFAAQVAPGGANVQPQQGDTVLVFTAGNGRRRAVRLAAAERVERVGAGAVHKQGKTISVVVGDEILPLAGADGMAEAETVQLLRLGDGTVQIAYAMRDTPELATLAEAVRPASRPGEVEGLALIGGEAVEVVDVHWLFAAHAGRARPVQPALCRLPAGDRWVETFLRPLVEAAGYRVAAADDDAVADLAIALDDDGAHDAAAVIRLTGDPAAANDDEIYRYDRDRLARALAAARTAATTRAPR